jgi:hypothetical protein
MRMIALRAPCPSEVEGRTAFRARCAVRETDAAQIRAPSAQQIEHDERGRRSGRRSSVDGCGLQFLKPGRVPVRIERDHLAIEHQRLRARLRPALERAGDSGN